MKTPSSDICTLTLRYNQHRLILFLNPHCLRAELCMPVITSSVPRQPVTCASQAQQIGKAAKMAGKDY